MSINEKPAEQTTVVPGQRLDGSRDRPAAEPGGCECRECECVFIGAEGHTLCRVCNEEHERWCANYDR